MTRIAIPNAKPEPVESQAADITIAAFRANGIDPFKAAHTPMCREMAFAWMCGDYSRADFNRACRNVLVMNPGLRLESEK